MKRQFAGVACIADHIRICKRQPKTDHLPQELLYALECVVWQEAKPDLLFCTLYFVLRDRHLFRILVIITRQICAQLIPPVDAFLEPITAARINFPEFFIVLCQLRHIELTIGRIRQRKHVLHPDKGIVLYIAQIVTAAGPGKLLVFPVKLKPRLAQFFQCAEKFHVLSCEAPRRERQIAVIEEVHRFLFQHLQKFLARLVRVRCICKLYRIQLFCKSFQYVVQRLVLFLRNAAQTADHQLNFAMHRAVMEVVQHSVQFSVQQFRFGILIKAVEVAEPFRTEHRSSRHAGKDRFIPAIVPASIFQHRRDGTRIPIGQNKGDGFHQNLVGGFIVSVQVAFDHREK